MLAGHHLLPRNNPGRACACLVILSVQKQVREGVRPGVRLPDVAEQPAHQALPFARVTELSCVSVSLQAVQYGWVKKRSGHLLAPATRALSTVSISSHQSAWVMQCCLDAR